MSNRRERNQGWGPPLLPWEANPDTAKPWTRDSETVSQPDKVVLYDQHGKPLTKARPRLGFRPEDAKP